MSCLFAAPAARFTVPQRSNSLKIGTFEGRWYKPVADNDRWTILRAAEHYDVVAREKGKRSGPIGQVGLEVLRAMLRVIDFRTGRLDPSITYLMAKTNRCRAAVVAGLAKLKDSGFLDWERRFGPTGNAPGEGPPTKQETNAYRLSIPEAVRKLRGVFKRTPPLPADEEQRIEERRQTETRMIEALPQTMRSRARLGQTSSLAQTLDRMASLFYPDAVQSE